MLGIVKWNRTQMCFKRLKEKSKFGGRPLIHMDTPINGGVYLGGNSCEAIVVEISKDEGLKRLYQEIGRSTRRDTGNTKRRYLH